MARLRFDSFSSLVTANKGVSFSWWFGCGHLSQFASGAAAAAFDVWVLARSATWCVPWPGRAMQGPFHGEARKS